MILEVSTITVITLIISILTLLGVGAFCAEFLKLKAQDLNDRTMLDRKHKKVRQIEETKAIVKEAMKEDFEFIKKDLDSVKVDLKLLSEQLARDEAGTLSCLRNDILTCYYRCNEKGYRNDYDYTNIHDMYNAYFAMGGNSFVEDIMKRFDALPTKEDFKKGE